MKVKVSEATGHVLDGLVAIANGGVFHMRQYAGRDPGPMFRAIQWEYDWIELTNYSPSTDWALGGPIIEREDISFRKYHRPGSEPHGKYYARICRESGTLVGWHKTTGHQQTGPTPLIAAMRCFVSSKLGDEVDVPEELL